MGSQARFKLELSSLIERYKLYETCGSPSMILAEHVIRSLSNLIETQQDSRTFFANEINASQLLPDPPELDQKIERSKTYMVFAETRALAIEWAVQNGITDWVCPRRIREVKSFLTLYGPHHYQVKLIGNGYGENLQIKGALEYAQLTLGTICLEV